MLKHHSNLFSSLQFSEQRHISPMFSDLGLSIFRGLATDFEGRDFSSDAASLVLDDEFARSLRELERIPSGQTKKDLQLIFL